MAGRRYWTFDTVRELGYTRPRWHPEPSRSKRESPDRRVASRVQTVNRDAGFERGAYRGWLEGGTAQGVPAAGRATKVVAGGWSRARVGGGKAGEGLWGST